jgi:hypothetical protein
MACRHAPLGLATLYREEYVGHWVTLWSAVLHIEVQFLESESMLTSRVDRIYF